jgi:hypothetical protein
MEYHELRYYNHWHERGVEAEKAEHEKLRRKMEAQNG